SFPTQEWPSFLGGDFCLYPRLGGVGVYALSSGNSRPAEANHVEGRVDRHSGEILVEDPRCFGDRLQRQSRCRELCSAVAVELGKNCKQLQPEGQCFPRGQLKKGGVR